MTKTHDYTKRGWGHDYMVTAIKGNAISLLGWGTGISDGDFLLLQNGQGSTRYKINAVRYRIDPPDMWRIEATFAPRHAEQAAQ